MSEGYLPLQNIFSEDRDWYVYTGLSWRKLVGNEWVKTNAPPVNNGTMLVNFTRDLISPIGEVSPFCSEKYYGVLK